MTKYLESILVKYDWTSATAIKFFKFSMASFYLSLAPLVAVSFAPQTVCFGCIAATFVLVMTGLCFMFLGLFVMTRR